MNNFFLNKKIIFTFLLSVFAHCFLTGQSNVLNLQNDQTGQPGNPLNNAACKEIHLLPGYRYAADPGKSMRAYIDPYMVCNVDYTNGFLSTNPPTLNTSYEVGSTPGSFAVTQTGGATYSVPLIVPPGTGGMVPNLAVTYSSQAGDRLLGMGWSLSGLSSISRVGQTLYHDGAITPVQLSNTDRYVLDGNRLIAPPNDYGLDGTVYGGEVETFSRITSFNQVSSSAGPQWFTVEAKDGTVFEYGKTADSKVIKGMSGPDPVVLIWLLNKVTDTRGNYMDFHYTINNGNGSFRPDYIEYTGNTNAGNPNGALLPYNQVKFIYGTRKNEDKQEYWVAGHNVQQNVLLTEVEMYAQNNLAHKYEFKYSYDMGSHLSEVIEKGTDGKQFNTTKFFYEDTYDINHQVSSFVTNATVTGSTAPIYALDFNGDGFSDIVRVENNKIYQFANNRNETFATTLSPINVGNYTGLILGGKNTVNADLDGDGIDDLLLVSGGNFDLYGQKVDNPGFKAYFSNGTSYTGVNRLRSYTDGESKFTLGDFDGDGATDLFIYFYDSDKGYIYSFKNNTNVGVLNCPTCDIGDQTLEFYTTDLNGDGKNEILYTFTNPWTQTSYSYVLQFNGSSLVDVSGEMGYPTGYHKVFPGDFNGDGKTDILTWSLAGWYIGYSTGDMHNFSVIPIALQNFGDPTETINPFSTIPKYFHVYRVADFNGDGKSDILDWGIANWTGNSAGPTYSEIKYSLGKTFTSGYFNTQSSSLAMFPYLLVSNSIGDYNGDGKLEFITQREDNASFELVKFIPNKDLHVVKKITNGLNQTIKIEYSKLPLLAQAGKYFKGTGASHPLIDFQGAFMVVSKAEIENGIGGFNAVEYSYEGAKIHLEGKGLLGFTKVKTTDNAAGMVSENTYEMDKVWLYANFWQPVLTNSKSYLINGQLISEKIINKYDYNFSFGTNLALPDNSGKRYHFYAAHSIGNDYLHGNEQANGTQTEINIIQNNSGIVVYQNIDNGVETIETTNIPFQTSCTWIPAHISSTKTKVIRTSEPPYIRTKSFVHSCFLNKTIGDEGVINELMYGPLGNVIASSVQSDLPTYAPAYGYDSKIRFVTSESDMPGHNTEVTYNDAYGNILTQKDLNGLVTGYAYDGFGRLKETTTPTNQKMTVVRAWDINTFPNSIYSITTSQPGTPTSKEYYDVLGRVLRTETQGFDGSTIFVEKTYNNLGQILTEGEPNNLTPPTAYTYEPDFKRLKEVNSPGGANIKYTYPYGTNTTNILTTAVTQRNSSKTLDASGKLISATDEGGPISYLYASCGKPKKIITGGAVTEMEYDNFGRQTKLKDPDAGEMNYEYYAGGEIKTQTDAKGNKYDVEYDAMQRMTKKTGSDGSVVIYHYDDPSNGIGMIDKVISSSAIFNGINCDYDYDSQSRLASKTEQNIDGGNYISSYQYDNLDRVTQITYPGGFGVKREYNSIGYLEKIKRADNNSLIWQCNTMNQRLQVTSALQENGGAISKSYNNFGLLTNINRVENNSTVMDWNFGFNSASGNLDNRINNLPSINSLIEDFAYDNLDRLNDIKLNTIPQLNIAYASNGNIAGKSDAGIYNYDPLPHAVSSIDAPSPELQATSQQDIIYNAFQKASTVSENGLTLQFTYGLDYARKISELTDSQNNLLRKIIYVGDYEKITVGPNEYEIKYIAGTDGLAAIAVKENSGQDKIYYVHTDHLGSIVGIYDENGQVFTRSFDAWGRERDYADWTIANAQSAPEWLIRGYTGHEHHNEFGLINMNGRMYDPVIARMLSPDNFMQNTDFTQAFNKYSYAGNNPLIYTDPSGDFLQLAVMGMVFVGNVIGNLMWGSGNLGSAFDAAVYTTNDFSNDLQVPIYEKGNTKITAGINPFTAGISANYYQKEGDWTFGANAGIGFVGGANITGNAGYTAGDFQFGLSGGYRGGNHGGPRLGGGVTYYDRNNNQYFSGGLTYFGGKEDQYNWYAGYRKGDFSFATTNDAGVGGDKYRTAAVEFGIGNFSYGINLYTTAPPEAEHKAGKGEGDKNYTSMWGKSSHGTYSSGNRVYAGMYVGYNNGTTVSRIGVDAPWVQDFSQNGFHTIIGSPYFNTTFGSPSSPFLQSLPYSPYSLY